MLGKKKQAWRIMSLLQQKIFAVTDLTCLNQDASDEAIHSLIREAQTNHVAAVCVYPKHLPHIPSSLRRATVLNFPSGQQSHTEVMTTLDLLTQKQLAEEIDYVFPYQTYLSGQKKSALQLTKAISQYCQRHQKTIKIILETGAFPSPQVIQQLSTELINIGCDFLKTSTGKISQGATLEAAFAMLSAIRDTQSHVGIKISGGLRTFEQATRYIILAEDMLQKEISADWFRIGTSGFST